MVGIWATSPGPFSLTTTSGSHSMSESVSPVPLQICFVVPSVDEALRIWHAKYGVGPWTLGNVAVKEAQVDGRDDTFAMRVGVTAWGSIELELIEPLDDRSQFAQSLAAHD